MSTSGGWTSWNGREVAEVIHRKAVEASERGARHLLDASDRTIPTDPGRELEGTGKVSTDERTATSAASYDTEYAVLQHERQDYEHDPGRRSKFLEQAMSEERAEIARVVRATMRI